VWHAGIYGIQLRAAKMNFVRYATVKILRILEKDSEEANLTGMDREENIETITAIEFIYNKDLYKIVIIN